MSDHLLRRVLAHAFVPSNPPLRTRRPKRAVFLAMVAGLAAVLGLNAAPASAVLPIEHWTTPNGARVYFVRAASIPMLDVSVAFDAGARFDPPGRDGLASLTNAQLAKGAGSLDENAIAEGFA